MRFYVVSFPHVKAYFSFMLSFITSTLIPVLILLLMGWLFFRIKWLNEGFIEAGSKLVFNVALPALLFLSIARADFSKAANLSLIGVGGNGHAHCFCRSNDYLSSNRTSVQSQRCGCTRRFQSQYGHYWPCLLCQYLWARRACCSLGLYGVYYYIV